MMYDILVQVNRQCANDIRPLCSTALTHFLSAVLCSISLFYTCVLNTVQCAYCSVSPKIMCQTEIITKAISSLSQTNKN
jgi:hypothetical protein